MRSAVYKFICDTGDVVLIFAKTRSQAIGRYCQQAGVTRQWVSDHCRIVFEGR